MPQPAYENIPSGEVFERLCSDLLRAEGFTIDKESRVDRTGFDIIASQDFKSHRGDVIKITWKVQCKHYAKSNKSLGRKEVEECLYAFECSRGVDEGLLFMIDTNYSEPAKTVIDNYVNTHTGSRVAIWTGLHLDTILERHPHLLAKYDLTVPKENYIERFASLSRHKGKRILIISDQSTIAHNLSSIFKYHNMEVVFLPHWNYNDPLRLLLFEQTVLSQRVDLITCFLGDSFQYILPDELTNLIKRAYIGGTSVLLFPFFAFCADKGVYAELQDIIPVSLRSPSPGDGLNTKKKSEASTFGDFSYMLTDLFAEDQYTEIEATDVGLTILANFKNRVALKHTFEYVEPKERTKVLLQDLSGNPVLVTSDSSVAKVAYFNTCTHSCLSTMPISSPIEASPEMALVFNDLIDWLLREG